MIKLEHRFVEFVPKELEDNVLYVSLRFSTVVHKCACGCGNKTITPLSPTDWRLIYNGRSVTIKPSIGNWSFPCQSHYWIKENCIQWASSWSRKEIQAGRNLSRLNKNQYYSRPKIGESKVVTEEKKTWWKFQWLFKN